MVDLVIHRNVCPGESMRLGWVQCKPMRTKSEATRIRFALASLHPSGTVKEGQLEGNRVISGREIVTRRGWFSTPGYHIASVG